MAARLLEAGGEGRGLAVVAAEAQGAHLRMLLGQPGQDRKRGVRAPVIYKNGLPSPFCGRQRLLDLMPQMGQAFLFVKNGNDEGQKNLLGRFFFSFLAHDLLSCQRVFPQ